MVYRVQHQGIRNPGSTELDSGPGLVYHLSESEDEIAIDNVPLVTAHAVLESLRYLEFETAKVTLS